MVIKVNRAATKQDLDARKGDVQLYLVLIRPTEKYGKYGPDEATEYSRQHLLYLWELEAAGKLFGAGPLERSPNEPTGMLILAAASKEEAIALAENEPHHKAGRRTNTVKGWTLNEGRATLFAEMMSQLAARNNSGEK